MNLVLWHAEHDAYVAKHGDEERDNAVAHADFVASEAAFLFGIQRSLRLTFPSKVEWLEA